MNNIPTITTVTHTIKVHDSHNTQSREWVNRVKVLVWEAVKELNYPGP